MATLFKPDRPYPLPASAEIVQKGGRPHARIREKGKPALYPLTKDGKRYLKPAAKWVADVRHADGTVRRVRFSPNRDAAAVMLAELLKKIENERIGVVDRFADHRKRPLVSHLADWQASLSASGRGDEYIALKMARVRGAFDGCRFTTLTDLSADRLEAFLLDLRVKEKRSVQTSNDWLQAVRQFCRWMIANERLDRDPFARLKPGNAKLDQRHRRGEFTPEEIVKLLDAAGGGEPFRYLAGPDRRMLYRVALGTGLRAAELAALIPDHFDLGANPPVAILPAEITKNRKGAVQPLAAELADDLRRYLKGKGRRTPLWPGTWSQRSADMLKLDLATAGVPSEVDGPEGIEVRDFHALRNCYISDVLRAGADLKQAMTLARHSDPRLTTARYARTRLFDLGSVVNKLPKPTLPTTQSTALRMTGTDSRGSLLEQSGAVTGAVEGGSGGGRLRIREEVGEGNPSEPETNNPLENQGVEEPRGLMKTIGAEREGFELPQKLPRIPHFSTSALQNALHSPAPTPNCCRLYNPGPICPTRSSWPSAPWCGRVSRSVAWFLPGSSPSVMAREHAAMVSTLCFVCPNFRDRPGFLPYLAVSHGNEPLNAKLPTLARPYGSAKIVP